MDCKIVNYGSIVEEGIVKKLQYYRIEEVDISTGVVTVAFNIDKIQTIEGISFDFYADDGTDQNISICFESRVPGTALWDNVLRYGFLDVLQGGKTYRVLYGKGLSFREVAYINALGGINDSIVSSHLMPVSLIGGKIIINLSTVYGADRLDRLTILVKEWESRNHGNKIFEDR